MIVVVISFVIFSLLLFQLKIFSVESDFNNFLINFLIVVGLFSVIITNLKTINLIIVVLIFIWAFLNKKWKFRFVLKNIELNFILTLFVGLFFLIVYNIKGEFFIPHEDYLFYSRLSVDNLFYEKESIGSSYNTYNYQSKLEVYHFFELWTASFGKVINGQNITKNLFFFSYPLATVLSLVGIKELIIHWFPAKKNSELIVSLLAIFLIGIFFVCSPWDTFIFLFKLSGISISEIGGLWSTPKILFVIPIIISLFIFLNIENQENLMVLLFACFLYFPILPIVLTSTIIWLIINYSYSFRVDKFSFIILASLISLLIFYFFNIWYSNNISTINITVPNFSALNNISRILPYIFLKGFIIPVSIFGSLFLLIYCLSQKFKDVFKKYYLFITIIYLLSFSCWLIFSINIDAKQPFFLLVGYILTMLSFIGILFLLNSPQKWIGILIYFIFLFPGFFKAYYYENKIKKIDSNTATFLKGIGKKRILYIPQVDEIKNIYSRNERVNTGINSFILINDSLELINISASYYLDTSHLNQLIVNSYLTFKHDSPFFNLCGNFNDSKPSCLRQYIKNYNIDYICTNHKNPLDSTWNNVFTSNYYNFYKSKYL